MNGLLLATFGDVMLKILYVIIAIVVLLTMVLIHEFGHYIVGRWLGFTITEFSIGFGKALWQKKNKRGELISFRIFPLGGYCAFLGEGGEDQEKDKSKDDSNEDATRIEDEKQVNLVESENNDAGQDILVDGINKSSNQKLFTDHKPWKRILVFVAGVTFNFLSAFIFSIIFLCVGGYDGYKLVATKGYTVNLYEPNSTAIYRTLTYNEAVEDSIYIYKINGTNVNYALGNVFDTLTDSEDNTITITILENGAYKDVVLKKENTETVTNSDNTQTTKAIYGMSYSSMNISYNFGCVLRDFIPFTFRISVLILNAFWMIITGAVALNQLGGPISTITQISEVASFGIANFLYLLPLLAANLAIFNILPIPGLDGSHVVFTTIEWIRGKPIKREIENAIHTWGILVLFAFVIVIDIVHMITFG